MTLAKIQNDMSLDQLAFHVEAVLKTYRRLSFVGVLLAATGIVLTLRSDGIADVFGSGFQVIGALICCFSLVRWSFYSRGLDRLRHRQAIEQATDNE